MTDAAVSLRAGADVESALAAGRATIERAGFALDYLELRDARTLAATSGVAAAPLRLLVAAKIGSTRLIDNMAV